MGYFMIVKETTKLDSENKNRSAYLLQCDYCSKEYLRYKRFTKEDSKHFCSPSCRSKASGTSVKLECSNCGASFFRRASNLKNSKSGLYYCSRACKDTAQTYEKEIQPHHYGKGAGRYSYRQKAFLEKGKECERCGYNKDERALDVHHIDRNRDNNDISNLEVLCCNCHAIEHRKFRE
jgi:hypothetical protein